MVFSAMVSPAPVLADGANAVEVQDDLRADGERRQLRQFLRRSGGGHERQRWFVFGVGVGHGGIPLCVSNGGREHRDHTGINGFRRIHGGIGAKSQLPDAPHLLQSDPMHEGIIARVRR